MSDVNNEFEGDPNEEFDTDLGFDDSSDQATKNNNKALFKVIIVAVGLVAVVIGIIMFTGGKETEDQKSQIAAAPIDSNSLPAQKEPTPEYREALENYNQQIVEQAKETGESVVPIPIDPSRQQLQTKLEEQQEDPAERFRRIQEEYRRQQELQIKQAQSPQAQAAVQAEAQAIEQLAQTMSSYLNSAMSSRQPRGTSSISVSYNPPSEPETGNGGNEGQRIGPDGEPLPPATMADAKVLVPAATVEYGQLLIEANTDAPGPVLALMASGKFSGARLLGSFQETDEYLTINFNQLVTKKGKTIPIQAIVLDPATTLPGVITEIDHKYFQRYILPAAADFISGVGQALAETQQTQTQSDSSTTTSSDEPDFSEAVSQGIGDSFDGISDAVKDSNQGVKPMLRVAAGTPIGILFTQPVLDPDSVRDIQAQMGEEQDTSNPYASMMSGAPGMFPSMMVPYGMMPYGAAPVGPAPSASGK